MLYDSDDKEFKLIDAEYHMSGENSFFGRAIDEDGNECVVIIWPREETFDFHTECHGVTDMYDGCALYKSEIDDYERFEIVDVLDNL